MIYPPVAEQDPAQKLVYYGLMTYAAVFESALAAGMSTSAAHHLARLQVGKYKFDPLITKAVGGVFADAETAQEQAYADFFLSHMAQVIASVQTGVADLESVMIDMSREFKPVTF